MKTWTPRLALAGFVVSLGVLAAACGGAATPGVATLSGNSAHSSGTSSSGTGNNGTKKHAALAFSKCMRKHGVKSFPDPGSGQAVQIKGGIDRNSPIFHAAEQACLPLLPKPSPAQLQKLEAGALKFSKCMRARGVTDFPDPKFSTSGGGIGISIGDSKGSLDPSSPTFQAAQKACADYVGRPARVKS